MTYTIRTMSDGELLASEHTSHEDDALATMSDIVTKYRATPNDYEVTVDVVLGTVSSGDVIASETIPMHYMDSNIVDAPTPTPARALVLVGKVGPRFGGYMATVYANGRRHQGHASHSTGTLAFVMRAAATDYATAVAS